MYWISKISYTVLIVSLFLTYCEGGTCQNRPRTYKTTCDNCKASRYCTSFVGSDSPVSPGICNNTCLSRGSCQMVQYNSQGNVCDMYNCTEVDMETGYSTNRLSCRSDCLLYEISFFDEYIGICSTLRTYSGQPSVERCLSLCLDLDECKGSTFWTNGSCNLHTCSNAEKSDTIGVSFFGHSCLDVPTTTIPSILSSSKVLQVSTADSSVRPLGQTSSLSLSQKAVFTFASSQLPEATNVQSSSKPADLSSMHTTTQLSRVASTKSSTTPFKVSSMLNTFPPLQQRSTVTIKLSSWKLRRTSFAHSLLQNMSDVPVTLSGAQTSTPRASTLLSPTQLPVYQSTQFSTKYTTTIFKGEITVQATTFWTKMTSWATTMVYTAQPNNHTEPNNKEGIFDNPLNVAVAASAGGVASGLAVGVGVQVLKSKQCDANANSVI